MRPAEEHERIVLAATGRSTIEDGLAWIAEGHRLRPEVSVHALLRSVLACSGDASTDQAVRRLTALAAGSDLDSASVLFKLGIAAKAEKFQVGLDVLARKSPSGDLSGLTNSSVRAAQREHPGVIDALCAMAGLSYKELRERISGKHLPANPSRLAPGEIDSVFHEVDLIVRGRVQVSVPGAVPTRPYELMAGLSGFSTPVGWDLVEMLRSRGVPYAVLLGQRAVGGAWLAHRSRTGAELNGIVADAITQRLDESKIEYLLVSTLGGDAKQTEIQDLVGGGNELDLVVHRAGQSPAYALALASARDGGTARRSIDNLLNMRDAAVPVAAVLSGPGFSKRNETADLARKFAGRVFSDRTIEALIEDIQTTLKAQETQQGEQ